MILKESSGFLQTQRISHCFSLKRAVKIISAKSRLCRKGHSLQNIYKAGAL